MKMNSLVSIIIPVFNGGNFLADAINSAINQSYKNIEVIVVNDGSSDQGLTESIALSYGTAIRYFKKDNGGVASALNVGIANMKGEFFSWLSHDDVYLPEKIEKELKFYWLQEDRQSIIYSDYYLVDYNRRILSSSMLPNVKAVDFRKWITFSSNLNGCTLLIPSSAFFLHGKFNEKLRTTQDYDLWFRLSKTFTFVKLEMHLVESRVHLNQDSIKLSKLAKREIDNLKLGFLREVSGFTVSELSYFASYCKRNRLFKTLAYSCFIILFSLSLDSTYPNRLKNFIKAIVK